jgi:predicted transcriptional regulator
MSLKDYCKKQNISMKRLAEITEVPMDRLYKIDKGHNCTVETLNKIYCGTMKEFGHGLVASLYTNLYT